MAYAQALGEERSDERRMVIMYEQGKFKRWVHCAACGGTIAVFAFSAGKGEVQESHVCKDLMVDIACRTLGDEPVHPVPQRPASVRIEATTTGSSTAFVVPPPLIRSSS